MFRARFSMRFLFVLVALAAVAALVLSWIVRTGVGGDMLQVASFAGLGLAAILLIHGSLALAARAVGGKPRAKPVAVPPRSAVTDAPTS